VVAEREKSDPTTLCIAADTWLTWTDPTLGPGAMASPQDFGCHAAVAHWSASRSISQLGVSELILMEGRRADSYIKDPCGKSEVVRGSTDRKTEGLEEEKTPTDHARTARIRYRCLVLSQ